MVLLALSASFTDRVPECREPSAGPGYRQKARDCHPISHGRRPGGGRDHAPVADGEHSAVAGRRCRWDWSLVFGGHSRAPVCQQPRVFPGWRKRVMWAWTGGSSVYRACLARDRHLVCLIPALQGFARRPERKSQRERRTLGTGLRHNKIARWLVVHEIALAGDLLVGSALSFARRLR